MAAFEELRLGLDASLVKKVNAIFAFMLKTASGT